MMKGLEARVKKEIRPLEVKMDVMCDILNKILEVLNKIEKNTAK